MSITSITSREFNQDTGRAEEAASKGPVFITDRGQAAHVKSIVDLLTMPEAAEIDFEPPRFGSQICRPVDFGGNA